MGAEQFIVRVSLPEAASRCAMRLESTRSVLFGPWSREIGIHKAVGATPRDILLQFLIESAIIAQDGGLIGIGVRVGGAVLLASLSRWSTVVSTTSVVVALVVSAGVGLFFGVYPAGKAAALHPIEALRYE